MPEIVDLKKFNYNQVNTTTAEYLKVKEINMKEIATNAVTQMGKELKEAQGELAKHGYGCFEEWYISLGFKKQTIYNLISRYEMIVQNSDNQNLIESLPKSLIYEIAKPSADQELKQKVLDGDITTNKMYQQAIKEKNDLTSQLAIERNKPPITIEKPIFPEDYHKLKGMVVNYENKLKINQITLKELEDDKRLLERKVNLNADEAKKYNDMKKQMDFLYKQKNDLSRQIDSATELSRLAVRIDHFLKTELAPIKYSRTFERMDSEVARENLLEILHSVDAWSLEIRKMIPDKYKRTEVF